MSDKTNPLRQYFRRPALYLKLPSECKGYPAGTIEMTETGELPVYPMTAIDEITSRTPDALFNGVAVTEIIKSCVPNIKDPWSILNIDLDPILIAIRIATNGQQMEIESVCPECKEMSKFDVNLTGILASIKAGDYSEPLKKQDLLIKFKPLTYKEVNSASENQFTIQKALSTLDNIQDPEQRTKVSTDIVSNLNELAMELMLETIEYIKTPDSTVFEKEFIREFLTNCDRNTYNEIRDKSIELRQSTELKPLDIKCVSCGHEHKQQLNINISDFFD